MLQAFFHAWERRLASVTTDRMVRPFEWGLDWIPDNGHHADDPSDALRAGIGFLPEERKTEGIFAGLACSINISLPVIGRLLRSRGTRRFYQVRLPAPSRAVAQQLCGRIQSVGGACVAMPSA